MRVGFILTMVGAIASTGALFGGEVRASVWNNSAGGSWSTAANWDSIPNAADAIANFSTLDLSTDAIVLLDGNKTVGTLLFGDTTPSNNWTLNAGTPANSTLTLDVATGSGIVFVDNPLVLPLNNISSTISETATLNVVVAGSDGLTKAGLGTLALTRANTYTGGTNIRAGAVSLDFSGTGSPASNILVSGSALNMGGSVNAPSPAILNLIGAAGGTHSQTLSSTTLSAGSHRIVVNQNGANAVNLSLGTITRNLGSVLQITPPATGSISAASASIPNVNGIIGGWATIGGDWAANDGAGNIVPYSGYVDLAATSDPTVNYRGTAGLTLNAGTTDWNTLNHNGTTASTITVGAGNTLRFSNRGGILRSAAPVTNALVFNGGVITAGTGGAAELFIRHDSITTVGGPGEGIVINSAINDNGGPLSVVKSGYGVARLGGNSNFSGGLYVLEGQVRPETNANSLGAGPVYISPGAQVLLGAADTRSNPFFISGFGPTEGSPSFEGGALRYNTNLCVTTGTITLLADARLGARGAQNPAQGGTAAGKITGNFNLELNIRSQQGTAGLGSNSPTLTLTNSGNDWGGNTTIGRGRIRIGGTGEVIPDGAGKGNLIIRGESGSESILTLDNLTETVNGLFSAGDASLAVITNSASGMGTLRVGNNNTSSSYAGKIADHTGIVQLVKIGTGTLTLSGLNSHSGPTVVEAGMLRAGSDTGLSNTSTLTLGAGTGSGTLDLAGFNPTVGGLAVAGTGAANIIGNSSTTTPSTLNYANGTSTFSGKIQNTLPGGTQTVALSVGSGALTLSGANTYTGETGIAGGSLTVNGSLAATGAVAVTGGALAGTGSVGNVTMQTGGTIRPGASVVSGNVGTLTAGSLTVNGGDFRVDLLTGSGNNDKVAVTGAANFAAASTITPGRVEGSGAFTILTAGTLSGTAPTLNAPPPGTARPTFALNFDTAGKRIVLNVTGDPKILTWTGGNGSAWDLNTTKNWSDDGGANTNETFFNLDSVIFGNSGANRDITLDFQAMPNAVTFNNNFGNDYSVSGPGGIGDSGLTTVTKSGTGKVTLNTDNSYTGATTLSAGILVINGNNSGGGPYTITGSGQNNATTLQIGDLGNTGSIGNSNVNDNGVLSFRRGDDVTFAGNITGSGQVHQDGATTLTLTGNNTFAGGLIINTGTVRATTAAGVGTGTIVVNTLGTLTAAATMSNPIALQGGTLGAVGGINVTTGLLTAADGKISTIMTADPQATATNSDVILTGTLGGNGLITVQPSTAAAGTVDGGPGFRLRGTAPSTFSGTITLVNKAKAEMQTSVAGPFSPAGTGKFILTGGTFTGALAGDYSQLVIRNNSGGNTVLGNDVEVTGTGLVVLNMLGGAPAGSVAALGNLKIGDGQILGVNKNGTPSYTAAFSSVTLTGGNATFAPTTFGFGSTGGGTADLILGAIGQSTPGSGIIMDGQTTLTINAASTYTGPTAVTRGALRVTGSIATSSGVTVSPGASFEAAASQTVKSLNINNGASASVTAGVLKVGDNVNATPLTIDSAAGNNATLDLTSRALIVDYPTGGNAASNLAAVRSQILIGFSGGTWKGAGITSSAAAASPGNRGVGYAQATQVAPGGTFLGTSVDTTAIIARATLLGDANLDATVGFADLVQLAQSYNIVDGTRTWYTGDFTNDGNTDFADLVKLAQNYNTALPTEPMAGASVQFQMDVAAASAAVPEPSQIVLLLGLICAAGRRRRSVGRL